jgi:uncharacterized protein (UPF0332 family)
MSSTDASRQWAEKHAEVVQRLNAGPQEPRKKLGLARRNLERARAALEAGDPDQAVISAETAMVNAADAVIAKDGYRLRGKTGAHAARFAYPGLPAAFEEERRAVSAARRSRNTAQYEEAGTVSVALATDVIRAAERLVDAARVATS